MGLTSISIKKSSDIGYAREISISAKKVRQTKRKTVKIPKYVLKAGESMADAGKASASKSSAKSSSGASSSSSSSSGGGSSKSSSGSSNSSNSKKSASILYGAANKMGFI